MSALFKKIAVAVFLKAERLLVRSIEKNIRSMGFSRSEALNIVTVYRDAVKMIKTH